MFIESVSKNQIWIPDTELLNAAGLPEIYTLKGGLMLYSDGTVFYSNPVVLKMPCSLELQIFPFDTQTCSMKFGSWVYSSQYLNLMLSSWGLITLKAQTILVRWGSLKFIKRENT